MVKKEMREFDFDSVGRSKLLSQVNATLEEYYAKTDLIDVSSEWDIEEIRKTAKHFNFDIKNDPQKVLAHVTNSLKKYAVHTPHPSYFGLFNPRPGFLSIMADLITATYNPQLAAWSHSPFANEIEQYIIQEFGKKFGYPTDSISGTFCSGGAESNLTAVICALNYFYPLFEIMAITTVSRCKSSEFILLLST